MPAALLALAAIPVVVGSIRVVQLLGGPEGIEPDSRFDAAPAAVVVHVTASIVYAVLGAFSSPPAPGAGTRPGTEGPAGSSPRSGSSSPARRCG